MASSVAGEPDLDAPRAGTDPTVVTPDADDPAPAISDETSAGISNDAGSTARLRGDWRNGLVMAVVLLALASAVWLVLLSRFRRASTVLAVTLFVVGLARLVLPTGRMGPLAVRSRAFDVLFCVLLGGVLTYLVAIE